ncbi:MAG: EamA-like transporter family protein [Candidatus Tokpelaia hoelldobleri]|uniref:EamA-like transporter family protein n=1 Tax=Candidatus Tokpelaia hoelldobleri TaxID=1902579 RepID=A0A1U9JVU7_9HYPH|nr:MAG: EamA-like transporter family protein [Candidatus Tokpelaia hoelldoblerii]
MILFSRLFNRPEMFALIAAMLNGIIGVFTRFGFTEGATHHQVAFWKCFIAFVLLLFYCTWRKPLRQEALALHRQWPQLAVLAFLGIFCLYFFETWAFHEASIPLVSFLTYVAGCVTILFSAVFLHEKLTVYKLAAFAAILCGVYLIYSFEGGVSGSYLGIMLALLGGLGYALFIFMAKLLRMKGGLPQLIWLFGFGSLYLLVPLLHEGFAVPAGASLPVIFALVLLPTIGGFYFTTRAVEAGEAGKVQIIETSDPLFSCLFAFVLFGDALGAIGFIGAACIMGGLLLAMKNTPVDAKQETV